MAATGRTWAQIASGQKQDAAPCKEEANAAGIILQQALPKKVGLQSKGAQNGRPAGETAKPQSNSVCTPAAVSKDLFKKDSSQSSDLGSTAASERDVVQDSSSAATTADCILCSGSGLLASGHMNDPCPLCDTAGDQPGDATGSEKSVPAGSQKPEAAEHPEAEKEESNSSADEAVSSSGIGSIVAPAPGTSVVAPPGLGPPGVWVWPHGDGKAARTDSDEATAEPQEEECETEDGILSWPRDFVDSPEVLFVGKAALLCYGSDFIRMTVAWEEPLAQGDMMMQQAKVQIHLQPMAPVYLDFLAPLPRLQSVLSRDQSLYQCHISHMSCSKDHDSLDLSCYRVSHGTCWDIVKRGYCPRPGCTWEHPVPTVINVTWMGGPELHFAGGDKPHMQNRTGVTAATATMVEKPNLDLFSGAYDESSSSDDGM